MTAYLGRGVTLAQVVATLLVRKKALAAMKGRIRREVRAHGSIRQTDAVVWLRARFPELAEADVAAIVAEAFRDSCRPRRRAAGGLS